MKRWRRGEGTTVRKWGGGIRKGSTFNDSMMGHHLRSLERTNRQTDQLAHGQTDARTIEYRDNRKAGQTGRPKDERTTGRMDRRVYAASSASEKTSTWIKDENVNDIASRTRAKGKSRKKITAR